MRVIESVKAVLILHQLLGEGKYAQAIISDFQKLVSANTIEAEPYKENADD